MFFIICRMKRVTTPSQSLAKTINDNHHAGAGPPDFADAARISGNATYEVSSIVLLCGKSD